MSVTWDGTTGRGEGRMMLVNILKSPVAYLALWRSLSPGILFLSQ